MVLVYNPDENNFDEIPADVKTLPSQVVSGESLVVVVDSEDLIKELHAIREHILSSTNTLLVLDCNYSELNLSIQQVIASFGDKVSMINGFNKSERTSHLTPLFKEKLSTSDVPDTSPPLNIPHNKKKSIDTDWSALPEASSIGFHKGLKVDIWNCFTDNKGIILPKEKILSMIPGLQEGYLRSSISVINQKIERCGYKIHTWKEPKGYVLSSLQLDLEDTFFPVLGQKLSEHVSGVEHNNPIKIQLLLEDAVIIVGEKEAELPKKQFQLLSLLLETDTYSLTIPELKKELPLPDETLKAMCPLIGKELIKSGIEGISIVLEDDIICIESIYSLEVELQLPEEPTNVVSGISVKSLKGQNNTLRQKTNVKSKKMNSLRKIDFRGICIEIFDQNTISFNGQEVSFSREEYILLDTVTKDATPGVFFGGGTIYRRIHNVHHKKRLTGKQSISTTVMSANLKLKTAALDYLSVVEVMGGGNYVLNIEL